MKKVTSVVIVSDKNKHTATIRCEDKMEDKIFSGSNKDSLRDYVIKYILDEKEAE